MRERTLSFLFIRLDRFLNRFRRGDSIALSCVRLRFDRGQNNVRSIDITVASGQFKLVLTRAEIVRLKGSQNISHMTFLLKVLLAASFDAVAGDVVAFKVIFVYHDVHFLGTGAAKVND